MMSRRSKDLRFSRTPFALRLFLVAAIVIALAAPMNFVLINPGPASPLFPKVIALKKASDSQSSKSNSVGANRVKTYPVKTYSVKGNLYLLTIYITNPESYVPGAMVIGCWVMGKCAALPRSVMYKKGTTDKKEIAQSKKEMDTSQSVAVTATKRYLAKKYPQINLKNFSDSSLKVSLENTGGPSGGLVFTLGLIDLLTPVDILQGRKIAGTGTISEDGKIGPIGGVTEKILGAKDVGASLLFISRENCLDLPSEVSGLEVVAIDTIDEAVAYLLQEAKPVNSAGIRGCASVGA
jgi:PDZ domain-containing protein